MSVAVYRIFLMTLALCMHGSAFAQDESPKQILQRLIPHIEAPVSQQILTVSDEYFSRGRAFVQGNGRFITIFYSPSFMGSISGNSRAFVFGHELGHIFGSNRNSEDSCDIWGSKLAIAAGYDGSEYFNWLRNDNPPRASRLSRQVNMQPTRSKPPGMMRSWFKNAEGHRNRRLDPDDEGRVVFSRLTASGIGLYANALDHLRNAAIGRGMESNKDGSITSIDGATKALNAGRSYINQARQLTRWSDIVGDRKPIYLKTIEAYFMLDDAARNLVNAANGEDKVQSLKTARRIAAKVKKIANKDFNTLRATDPDLVNPIAGTSSTLYKLAIAVDALADALDSGKGSEQDRLLSRSKTAQLDAQNMVKRLWAIAKSE